MSFNIYNATSVILIKVYGFFLWNGTSVAFKIQSEIMILFVLFYLILYVPSTIFQLNRDGSSWVEPVLS